jgi:hypothetical protein
MASDLPIRILIRTNVDWASMDTESFGRQSDPTLPVGFIRRSVEHRHPEVFAEAFGVGYFRYRGELARIAREHISRVHHARVSVAFDDFEQWFLDDSEEFIFPTDDDDVFSPHLAEVMRGVEADTNVVLWSAVQAGYIAVLDPSIPPGAVRYDFPILFSNNWGIRKSFLRSKFDMDGCKLFLSDHQVAQRRIAAHVGVVHDTPASEFPFVPLFSSEVARVDACYSVQLAHPGSLLFFGAAGISGPLATELLRKFDPSVLVDAPDYAAWAGPFLREVASVVPRLKAGIATSNPRHG